MFFISKFKNFLLDLLFPLECLSCGQEGSWLCENCFRDLQINTKFVCLDCKKDTDFGEFCPDCAPHHSLSGVWIAGDFHDKTIAKLVKTLKYRLARDIAKDLAIFLNLYLKNLVTISRFKNNLPETLEKLNEAIIMPVPLHKKRLRWRGFNQTELIADNLSFINISHDLIRVRYQKPQAKLNKKQRLVNLENSFIYQGPSLDKKNIILDKKNIILIDDIVTTGATLEECAKALKQAGANEVWGLVVASN